MMRNVQLMLIVVCMGLMAGGCDVQSTIPGVTGPDLVDGNRDGNGGSSQDKSSGEPNGSFDSALVARFDGSGVAALQGTIAASTSSAVDVDVFDLGPLQAGDYVVISAEAEKSSLDINAALFDDQQRLAYVNDDRSDSNLDAQIEFVVRHSADPYYLAISASEFAETKRNAGAYIVDVQVTTGFDVPAPVSQILMLDFAGGEINNPALGGRLILEPFDAADISPFYEGSTAAMKKWIQATMEQNFERYNITIITSDDPIPDERFSTLYFGGMRDGILGFSEDVDDYNFNRCDDGIIYVESFDPRDGLFFVVPSALELGVAIGNVATHEMGHLLGLNHVDDELAIMDTQSAASSLLDDQEFIEAPLNVQISPLGFQDAALLLEETLGPALDALAGL